MDHYLSFRFTSLYDVTLLIHSFGYILTLSFLQEETKGLFYYLHEILASFAISCATSRSYHILIFVFACSRSMQCLLAFKLLELL